MAINIQTIKTFPALIKYLRTELGWPVDEDDAENLTFSYSAEELGLDEKSAVKVRTAKQLRPLVHGQPWGIFWIDFEPKKLPITVMRRILNQLVARKRGGKANQATWNLDDLMFISAVGDEKTEQREITFAHFHQETGDLPTFRVLGWDGADTPLKIDYVAHTLKEILRWPQNTKDIVSWRLQWSSAFMHKPGQVIRSADALAEALAELARKIRDAALVLMKHESDKGRLRGLHEAFQEALIHDLSEADFADTYAQTITYGLLTAAISRTDLAAGPSGTVLVAQNVSDMVPVTNPFLSEMLQAFLKAGGRKGGIDFDELGVQDVVELLRGEETDLPAVLRDFNNRTPGEDPVIHFYQNFLNAYNRELRIQRGVFYTPRPVVQYIVRSVHELLQSKFGLDDGLADTATWGEMEKRIKGLKRPNTSAADSPFVTMLDPATGTATFLVEVIDVIYKTMTEKWMRQKISSAEQQRKWNDYVPKNLLPRLYGYELMMAPYAIAHMKIGLKLFETGYRFGSNERARIYLTNSLEEPSPFAEHGAANLFEALGHEARAVNAVKRKTDFTVVIGNPPYSGISANASVGLDGRPNFIGKLLDEYYFVDGARLGERKLWLQDDYVKFTRFGEWRIAKTGCGVLAFITNHGYIDNPTFRGMRQHLMTTFDEIYIWDLHGNSKKKEKTPQGDKDENVFDIQQGVAIMLAATGASHAEQAMDSKKVYHADIWGPRQVKYNTLNSGIRSVPWDYIRPASPAYLFKAGNEKNLKEYREGWSLPEILPTNVTGIVTARDDFVIDFEKEPLSGRMRAFVDAKKSDREIQAKFGLHENYAWRISAARDELRTSLQGQAVHLEQYLQPMVYRPFDNRWIYFHPAVVWRTRPNVMPHMLAGPNLGFITTRQTRDTWGVLITDSICGHKSCAAYDINSLFPLYLYSLQDASAPTLFPTAHTTRRANLAPAFIRSLEHRTGFGFIQDGSGDLIRTLGPEDFLHYAYAIFYSPAYRTRYAHFLSTDFPRLPLTSNTDLFRDLCGLGAQLMRLHLLQGKCVEGSGVVKFFTGRRSYVERSYPKYDHCRVFVNGEHYFDGVAEDVWDFHIGGYQVCDKWLKDRRGRELSKDDIEHYKKIVVALGETIRLMKEIDETIDAHGGWPIK